MIGRPEKVDAIKLNDEVIRILDEMSKIDQNTEEYTKLLTQLERLSQLRTNDRPRRVSPDTIATTATYLFGILIIVAVEQTNVMNSKALGFLPKWKNP